ncbi:MAG TPA: DUF2752 domain-containing protein [Thermoanaerobaculia bacterium]|nr:DUF2752 domain-containing protein [Thermoanaerobaculia bacterium]
MDRRRKEWQAAGLLGIAGIVGLAVLHFWTPSEDPRDSVCLFRRFLGLPCPGCGMTRALAHLAKGEWRAALLAHPFAPVLAGELLLAWLTWGATLIGFAEFASNGWKAGKVERWLESVRLAPLLLAPLLLANAALLTALWMGRLASGALPR